jgi:hypothetical protein
MQHLPVEGSEDDFGSTFVADPKTDLLAVVEVAVEGYGLASQQFIQKLEVLPRLSERPGAVAGSVPVANHHGARDANPKKDVTIWVVSLQGRGAHCGQEWGSKLQCEDTSAEIQTWFGGANGG